MHERTIHVIKQGLAAPKSETAAEPIVLDANVYGAKRNASHLTTGVGKRSGAKDSH